MPFAVDKVNPEALAQIAEDLDGRDKERIRTGQELCAEADKQMALLEALAWYNGSKRTKFEDGKVCLETCRLQSNSEVLLYNALTSPDFTCIFRLPGVQKKTNHQYTMSMPIFQKNLSYLKTVRISLHRR